MLLGLKIPWSNVEMNIKKPLANSCCKTSLGLDPAKPGDFIFDSARAATNRIPANYDNMLPQSDHRPVEAVCGNARRTESRTPPPSPSPPPQKAKEESDDEDDDDEDRSDASQGEANKSR